MEGVSLKSNEIYINGRKGLNCSLDNSTFETWPLGDIIKENILNVSKISDMFGLVLFILIAHK